MHVCLTPRELAELWSGNLSEPERALRENHLGECQTCQQVLLHLSGDEVLSGYRKHRQNARRKSPALPADYLERWKQASFHSAADSSTLPETVTRSLPVVP